MTDSDHEFAFTSSDFQRVRLMLHDHSGISLAESKRSMVYNRLARRLRAHNLMCFDTYLDMVEHDEQEREACINALTTNLTSFFREPHHFAIMADYIARRNRPRLRIWCAASSTGEEPYTIAMTMIEAYNTEKPPVEIIASDIDTDVLAHAQRGVYAIDRLSTVSEKRRMRFFQRGNGPNTGFARVRPELRTLIDFRRINLQDPVWPIPDGLDIIICRNVLIYFQMPTQEKILNRFAGLIAPGGLLIMGHSENIAYANNAFVPMGQTVYSPRAGAPPAARRDLARAR